MLSHEEKCVIGRPSSSYRAVDRVCLTNRKTNRFAPLDLMRKTIYQGGKFTQKEIFLISNAKFVHVANPSVLQYSRFATWGSKYRRVLLFRSGMANI